HGSTTSWHEPVPKFAWRCVERFPHTATDRLRKATRDVPKASARSFARVCSSTPGKAHRRGLCHSRTQQHLPESTGMRGHDDEIEFFVSSHLANRRSVLYRL